MSADSPQKKRISRRETSPQTYNLDTLNLRTTMRAQLEHIGRVFQKIRHSRVRSVPRIIVLERTDWYDFLEGIIVRCSC